MKLQINIEIGNAAFDDAPMSEVARILRDYATRIENDGDPCRTLHDINGNSVGTAELDGKQHGKYQHRPALY